MTDIEGFLTIYGHSDNLLNNKVTYNVGFQYCLRTRALEEDRHCKFLTKKNIGNYIL